MGSSTESTAELNRTSTPPARICLTSSAVTSLSRNGRIASRPSIRVTLVPMVLKIVEYSHPMTPAPMTTNEEGNRESWRIVLESWIRFLSK